MIVAKSRSTKPPAPSAPKTRVSHTIDTAMYRRFRIAAAEADMTESELFEWLVTESLSSVHSRGVPEKLKATLPQAGQGTGSDALDQTANVVIPRSSQSLTNRISAVVRSAHMPIDSAIETYGD
jgi:hypothetical protein